MPQQPRLLFGSTTLVTDLLRRAERFARTSLPILLLGEPGTGKTVLARHLHRLSGRQGEFIEESAPRIPNELAAAYLEGHARGAYTGAYMDRTGLFEVAHQGTFFLDEIGKASDHLQLLLLRLLENRPLRRIGDVRERRVDVRIIAATNEDLKRSVRSGHFRADLLDRFGYIILRMPRLVERREDILPLARNFLEDEAVRLGIQVPSLADEVEALLMAAAWPGNQRQLRTVCQYAIAMATPEQPIGMSDLPIDFLAELGDLNRRRYEKAADRRERIRRALTEANGKKAHAARMLGISRTHLYRLIASFGLAVAFELCNLSGHRLHFPL